MRNWTIRGDTVERMHHKIASINSSKIQSTSTTSSVARGGLEPPHWLVKYAKSHVFCAFEADFLQKIENSPPQTSEFAKLDEKLVSISVKTFFFFFWRTLGFGRKKHLNFRAFREISSQFSDKPSETDSSSMKIRVKVVCTLLTLSK